MRDEEYYRSVELSLMRRHMKYRQEQYEEDWKSCIAIAQIMAVQGESNHMQRILDGCFKRILAYESNTHDVPWITEKDL